MGFSREEQKVARTLELAYGAHNDDYAASLDGGAKPDDDPHFGWGPAKVEAWDRKVCVMEFVNFVRHGIVDDEPPCVSMVIRNICIERNDEGVPEEVFSGLKNIAPEVIHTAPTRIGRGLKVVRATSNPEYRAAERKRRAMRAEFVKKWCAAHDNDGWDDEFHMGMPSVRAFNAFLRELIAVAKFEPVGAVGAGCGGEVPGLGGPGPGGAPGLGGPGHAE